jgi:NADH:ubiquinone oxidoreductase subunit 4 (subunit M)
LNKREIVYLTMILVFIVWIGVYPKTFLSRSQVTIDHTISLIDKGHKQTLLQWKGPGGEKLLASKGQRQ